MDLTDDQKTRILYFLGYPDWQSLAQSIQLGIPAAGQPLFLVYSAFNKISARAVPTVLRILCNCEAIECQLMDATSRMKATKLGELTLNPQETMQLQNQLTFWVRRLGDAMGVIPNPYSQINYYGYGGGINARVNSA